MTQLEIRNTCGANWLWHRCVSLMALKLSCVNTKGTVFRWLSSEVQCRLPTYGSSHVLIILVVYVLFLFLYMNLFFAFVWVICIFLVWFLLECVSSAIIVLILMIQHRLISQELLLLKLSKLFRNLISWSSWCLLLTALLITIFILTRFLWYNLLWFLSRNLPCFHFRCYFLCILPVNDFGLSLA